MAAAAAARPSSGRWTTSPTTWCHPQHAAKVILSSTSPHMAIERKLAMFEQLGGLAARAAAQAFWSAPAATSWAEYNRLCSPLYNTKPAADPQARGRTLFNEDILFTSASGEQQTMNLLPGLAAAACPVLVLAGEHDPVCPMVDSLDIAAALPARWMQLARIADAGHGTWRDQPEAAFARLREFILQAD